METNEVNTAKRAFPMSVLPQHWDTYSMVTMATVTKVTSLAWRASKDTHRLMPVYHNGLIGDHHIPLNLPKTPFWGDIYPKMAS